MMIKTRFNIKICGILLCYLVLLPVLKADTVINRHLLSQNMPDMLCQQCHVDNVKFLSNNVQTFQRMGFKKDEISMCIDCHADNASSHSVNVSVDFPVPADLPLSATGRMTCLTCHKVHGQLQSNRPWASVNFMDRLLNSECLTKTYLLRRNNANGELCLVCHDYQEEHSHE